MEKVKILIVGTGAIGSFYGGKLAQAGTSVSVVCRSDYEVVKQSGIAVKSVNGDFHFTPDEVVKKVGDYSAVPDYIMVCTKVLPSINIVETILEKVGEKTAIVLVQNGIDIERPIKQAFPDNELISGLAFICISRTSPGHVYHQDYGRLVIGNYPSGMSDKTMQLFKLLIDASVPCLTDENIISSRWKKMVWNAPFNPISVIGGGVDTRTMLENEESSKLVRKVMEEVVLAAGKSGFPQPASVIQKNMEDTLKMTPYKTSMLLDHENKRPMEVEAILGNTVRIARKHKLDVPNLEALYALLQLIDGQNR